MPNKTRYICWFCNRTIQAGKEIEFEGAGRKRHAHRACLDRANMG